MSETCWAHKKWNKIAIDIKLVFYSSTITMTHGPINISFFFFRCFSCRCYCSYSDFFLPIHCRCKRLLLRLVIMSQTFGRTSPDEGPARHRDFWQQTTLIRHTLTPIPPTGFEPAIPVRKRMQKPRLRPSGQWDLPCSLFRCEELTHKTFPSILYTPCIN